MLINGKQMAGETLAKLREEIASKKLNLKMAAVLACPEGVEGLALKKFVELKEKAARSIGVGFQSYFFDENISENELIKEVEKISGDSKIDGIFIELPLPKHINIQNILDVISASKDLDALSKPLQDKFFSGDFSILPPAVESVKMILDKYSIDLWGKKIAVFGYGFLVGKPVAFWMDKQGAQVSVIRSKTENPADISREADIIISGVGKPELITGGMVKEGAVVIDFGYGRLRGPDFSSLTKGQDRKIEDPRFADSGFAGKTNRDKMVGDVDYDSVAPKSSLITPVPGGMGPILITTVLGNLVKLKIKN